MYNEDMTIILYSWANKISEKIPAVLLGLILDSLTIYGLFSAVRYHLEYFGL